MQDSVDLSADDAYTLLSNSRRRYVIAYLREHPDVHSVGALSEAVAAWENEMSRDELTDQQIKRVYVSLHQTHLPKLVDAGLIKYDRDSSEVRATPAVAELNAFIPEQSRADQRWDIIYGITAAVAVVLFLIIIASSATAEFAAPLGVLTIGAFIVIAVGHYLLQRKK